ncbi:ribosome-binding factor A [Legionella quinlivanii]|uniref:Ribosome-binding factor A n=1 Tax=Legionella quinlivanii TaxID=45073 RepID=A0A0W0Y5T1_9GAMM|nr:30S ribosome-binding factor RbfA [Legionella quinlivanii]KTD52333.1 ribosome-binding factor A [Legionella quinlivanii]MCW8449681.1 30S ribosome-binding factor RbfA [Legionella quinlivanii]SEF72307.1 ribosome-binding factor A [Legionella quinlivanii DSM 21216]STY12168.1 ribosome-binding factor A [Legionella quinlivanii]
MSNFKRVDRVAEMLQRELSQLIQQEVRDPRLPSFVTISAVKVSPDLSHAKVYFTVLNHDVKMTAEILNAASSYLRTALARSVKLRIAPQLHFIYDESIEYGRRLSKLIDDVNPAEPDEDA